MKAFVGIDPGREGAMVSLFEDGDLDVQPIRDMTPFNVLCWFKAMAVGPSILVMEKVGGHTKRQAGVPGMGWAMFNFGRNVGMLETAAVAAGLHVHYVPPQEWQGYLGVQSRRPEETRTQFKNRLKTEAQRLFPSVKVTLATADALLLATYCKLRHGGR